MKLANKIIISATKAVFFACFAGVSLAGGMAVAADQVNPSKTYLLQPGDVLAISVWKEDDLTNNVIVRPDGRITFPLVGETTAAGNSIEAVRQEITGKLKKYIPDPVVTVSIQKLSGNIVYVIGKVNRPGQFELLRDVDVMQALSMAGGTSTYAALNKIKILRRENGKLTATPFEYGEVEKGEHLEQNIILKAGDVVVVP
jgi:polysaccharide export outer membrane protein